MYINIYIFRDWVGKDCGLSTLRHSCGLLVCGGCLKRFMVLVIFAPNQVDSTQNLSVGKY